MKLPTFLVGGAQKAGTTALYTHLQAHPDVFMSTPKETEFFNWRYDRGWDWFAKHFEPHQNENAIGEASTRILTTPEAPHRINERMPDVRLIFLLRNPVERAFSAFHFYRTQGIICAGDRFSSFIRNEGHPLRHELIDYGKYAEHLSRFDEVFSKTQILLIKHEEFRANPVPILYEVAGFIGVEPEQFETSKSSRKSNVTQYPVSQTVYEWGATIWRSIDRNLPLSTQRIGRLGKSALLSQSKPSMSEGDRTYLQSLYRDSVAQLESRVGHQMEWF